MTTEFEEEFVFGDFHGYVKRQPFIPSKFRDGYMTDEQPECWSVTISGEDGRAWREILVPLKRGRSYKHAISLACSMFTSPNDIKTINGQFGMVLKYEE